MADGFDKIIEDNDNLLRGIYAYGWNSPSAIQEKALPRMLKQRDLVAQAQSGTGKTGAFSIPALHKIDYNLKKPQVLIIAHTRELAQQIFDVIINIGSYIFKATKTTAVLLVGGVIVKNDLDVLKREDPAAVIIIGTPGRINDVFKRPTTDIKSIKLCIIDEADELLSHGFKPQTKDILNLLGPDTQKALFSATIPDDVLEFSNEFLKEPFRILEKVEEIPLKGIKQFKIDVAEEHKITLLFELFESISVNQSIIFINERKRATHVSQTLTNRDYPTEYIHSELDRQTREKIAREFKNGCFRVLVASDLFCRGIDVHHVSIVVNFDIPQRNETYIHRIGRAGRYGRKGLAINMVSPKEKVRMQEIEKFYGIEIDPLTTDFESYLN